MSYRRFRRRFTKRNPRFFKKRGVYGGRGVAKLKKDVGYLKRLARERKPELKWFDTSNAALNPFTTGDVINLTAIPQGDTAETRDGDVAMLKSLQIRLELDGNLMAGQNTELVRLVLIKKNFNSPVESGPTWAAGDVYETAEDIVSLREISGIEARKYSIFFDKTFKMIKDVDGTTNNKIFWKYFKKLNHKIEFQGAAVIAQTGGLFLMYISTAAENNINLNIRTRVRFTDI